MGFTGDGWAWAGQATGEGAALVVTEDPSEGSSGLGCSLSTGLGWS